MKNARKFLITTATSEIFVVRHIRQQPIRVFCSTCGTETEMLELNSAVTVSGLSTRELIGETEKGAVHSVELESGHLFVCAESLRSASLKKK